MRILAYRTLRNPRRFSPRSMLLVCLLAGASLCEGATVKGIVTNKTTNKPDVGDEVVLVALTQNMQDVARTKTDSKGHYSIELPDNGMHLVRVVHQKAAYFAAVPPGKTQADVDVYDVASKLEGVITEADMARMETDPQGLRVAESYFVKNESSPPRTQFGPRTYEIYLPAGAQIEASIAMGPGGMPVASQPVPTGESGHYAFIFPVRPGETRFQVTYHLPYSGSYTFHPRVSLATANFAAVLPKSMQFAAGPGVSFQPLNDDNTAQTFLAKNVQPSQALAFTVSGNGSLPRDAPQAQENQGQPTESTSASAGDTRPGIGLGAPIDTPDPLSKYKWWILTGFVLIFAVAAALFLRSRPTPNLERVVAEISTVASQPTALSRVMWLDALKEELFLLETERIEGKLTEAEYWEQKSAFEAILKRTLVRDTSNSSSDSR
jgi:hypothetical protein